MMNANINNIAQSPCSNDLSTENAIVSTTINPKTPKMCIAKGCKNQAVQNQEWQNEYCSFSCTYIHCKATFTTWLSNNKHQKQTITATPATQVISDTSMNNQPSKTT